MSSAVVPSGMDPSNVHEEVLSPQKWIRGCGEDSMETPPLTGALLNILDSVRWVQGQWRLVLPTSDYEKERFCLYAKFVRSFFSLLSSNPPGPLDIDANIFLHLELQGFSRPLFQLHSVVVPIVPSYYLPVLPPLLSPNLIDIRVFVPEGGAGCVSQILAESPEIKRLDLSGYILPEDLLFLPSLSCLEHLFINLCQDTTEVTTRRLLAALQALTLRDSVKALHCIIPFHIQVPVVSIARRGSITTLHLRATSTVALRNLSAIEQLVDVTLELSDSVVGSTDVYPCFEVLASTSKETLRSVTLISNGTAALSASIIPLLGIREMRQPRHDAHRRGVAEPRDSGAPN
ncbi:hypothetical protein NLJ89_g3532 [Agrocybe chaxingu]|uniref:Uncharacterized protein n=1 Tax=Agrocybe chaxingu TaxID=84603 RepID=A0A9W8MXA3_9AGAR|nr:hypothetical protein NLJ89_g3532 [Agrocybe chaxingu]